MFEKSSPCGKRNFISSSGLQASILKKNGLISCVKVSSSSNVRKFNSLPSLEVKNGLFLSTSKKFAHRDSLLVIKRGKYLYKNRFFETYHVIIHRDRSIFVKQCHALYQNKFSETFGVTEKASKPVVIVIKNSNVIINGKNSSTIVKNKENT